MRFNMHHVKGSFVLGFSWDFRDKWVRYLNLMIPFVSFLWVWGYGEEDE